ncbi:unnamed protein product [Meloidogyne enterolobii]|uniref:Uncharacterized protein n=1 Tax=Meloidogyne enterolobii TaxID=390850 RepID=A0ACB0XPD9_MELEN
MEYRKITISFKFYRSAFRTVQPTRNTEKYRRYYGNARIQGFGASLKKFDILTYFGRVDILSIRYFNDSIF